MILSVPPTASLEDIVGTPNSAPQGYIYGLIMQHFEDVRNILADVLALGERKASLDQDTALMGSLPELDSMAVVNVLTALEEHFGITIEDDEISAATFETLGSLTRFVEQKMAA
jgi:acyl carrier protein